MSAPMKGRKFLGGSSSKATRRDDTLFAQDTVEMLLGLSEGPIYGLREGPSDFFVGDVPLLDKASQTPNISNFELRILKGLNPADPIRLNLGGVSASKNVGLDLRTKNQSVVVNCTKTQIDYIDLRFIVQRLIATDDKGNEFAADLQLKVEIKPRSSGSYTAAFTNVDPAPVEASTGGTVYRPGTTAPGVQVNEAYRETYIQSTAPATANTAGAVWFNSGTARWTPRTWSGTAWVAPTNLASSTRSGFDVWTWTETDAGATVTRTAWFSPTAAVPPAGSLLKGDFLLTPSAGEQVYSYNDTAWVGFQNWASPTKAAPGTLVINGLTRSTYPKEYRIPVARIAEPYDLRITRLSDATTTTVFRDVNFESVQEINRDPVTFNDLAVAWLTIKATDTFTSIPEMTGIYRGLLIPVPSNYTFDESTKSGTYQGTWDGLFKLAYTNNPAWHAYNFIANSRYGKNAYFPETPDKWDFYEFGKHCDLHKFRFNEYITEPRSINELINYVVGIAGGRYIDRGDGYSSVIWDADDQVATALFSPENVVDGSFIYSFTDVTERKNDFKVSFKNPALNYREDRVRVFDQASIDVNGRNTEEFVAVGCRDAEEAVRRGRLRLATSLTEKTIVNFKTSRVGRYLQVFGVILVADEDSSSVISGRVRSADPIAAGTTILPLRDQIYLEAGIAYNAQFTVSDGNGGLKLLTLPLTVSVGGQQTQLRLTSPLPQALPEYAVFSIGTPKAFRVTSIVPDDNDPDIIDITAMEVNRQKWAFVDGLVELRDLLGNQTGPLSKFVYPVTNAKITPKITAGRRLDLVATWDRSATKLIRKYRVYCSIDGSPMEVVAEPISEYYQISNVRSGTYILSIVAIGLDGTTESAPVTVQYIVAGNTTLRSVAPPTNLRLVGEANPPFFAARDAAFAWDASADPLLDRYRLTVRDGANAVVGTYEPDRDLSFTYSLERNTRNGGPRRAFTVQCQAVDRKGNFSEATSLSVSHPAPVAPLLAFDTNSETIFLNFTVPDGDVQGIIVWMETTSGYDPLTKTPKYTGAATGFVSLKAKSETTYYIRAALYDSYGKTGLNITAEYVVRATIQLFDPNAPERPARPALTSSFERSIDGVISSSVTATWAAVTSENLSHYEVAWQIGSGSWAIRKVETNTATERGFLPASTVNVRVYSVSKMGFRSDPSEVATIVTAKSTVAPANPTNAVVAGKFERALIAFTPPADKDLDVIEVWGFDRDVANSVPPSGSRLLGTVPYGQSAYSDEMPTTGSRTYWLRSLNTSGIYAVGYLRAGAATTAAIQAAQIAAGIIDATKLATSLAVPTVVTSLPTTKTSQFVTLDSDGKLYRWDAAQSKYVPASLQVSEITGLTADQIASVNAAAVAGQLTDAQIAGIAAGKVAGQLVNATLAAANLSGAIQAAQIAGLEASKITGQLSNAQLSEISAAKIAGQLTSAQIASIEGAKLTGTVSGALIDAIATSKLSGTVTANQIADAAITLSKFGTGLAPIGEVSSLPATSGYTGPRLVRLTTDGKLYRLVSNAWVTGIAAVDISGTIQASQIAALEAAKITGQLTNAQVASLDAAKIAGQLTDAQIAGIAAGKVAGSLVNATLAAANLSGAIQAAQIAALEASKITGQLSNAQLAEISAAKIAGQLSDTQLAGISAGKVAGALTQATLAAANISGTLAATQIAALEASKITGTLSDTQIAAVSAAKVSGQLTDTQIAGISAGKVAGALVNATLAAAGITGTISDNQIAGISATKLAGQVQAAQLAGIEATKVTGQITGVQITDNAVSAAKIAAGAITAGKIAAGVITASEIAAGAVTASKLLVASTNIAANGDLLQGLLGLDYAADNGAGPTAFNLTLSATGPDNLPTARLAAPGTLLAGRGLSFTLAPVNAQGVSGMTPVRAGDWYEASVYPSGQSSLTGFMQILWYDATGTLVTPNATGSATALTTAGNGTLLSRNRAFVIAQAPTGATQALLRVRFRADADTTNTVVTAAAWMLAPARAGQTEPSPFVSPGITTINGGNIVTRSIVAAQLVAGTITANEIAANAVTATQIAADAVTATQIAANAVTATQLNANAVTAAKIATGAVTADAINANAVTATKIAAGAVTTASMTAGSISADRLVASSITAGQIATNAITADAILASAITTAKLATGAVTANEIASNAITAVKIDANAVTAAKIAAGAVTADAINANAVTAGKIAAGAVVTASMAANSIDADRLVAASITAAKIAANTITATQIAANTITASNIQGGTITAAEIASGAITTIKLDANAVTTAKLAAGAVTADQIGANAITAGKIAAGAVVTASMTAGAINADRLVANSITTSLIAANAITATEIAANSVTADQLTSGAVTTAKLDALAVTAVKIAAGAIIAGKIAANAVTATEIAANAVTATQIAAGTIVAGNIATDAITAVKISANAVTTAKIAANAVTANEIAANTIVAGNIATGAIVAAKIDAGAVVAGKIAANAVTAGNIAANAVTAREIAANTITAANISAGTITAAELAANSVTATQLAANAVVASNITAGAITAGKIAANAVTATEIASRTITANQIATNGITANEIAANTITAANISAGAIGVAQLAAGAIVADKIGVGINTGNLLSNSDCMGTINSFRPTSTGGWSGQTNSFTAGAFRDVRSPAGMRSAYIQTTNTPAANAIVEFSYYTVAADGSWSFYVPVTGGQRYEYQNYTATVRCTSRLIVQWYDATFTSIGGASLVSLAVGPRAGGSNQPLTAYGQNAAFVNAPAGACFVRLAVRGYADGTGAPSMDTFAWMLAKALPNQTEFSPWAPQSASVIDGGTIAANTITAREIAAGTITADHISATNKITAGKVQIDGINGIIGAINISAETISAASVTVGSARLNSWVSSTDTTQINGGKIAANSIQSGSLQIADRDISITGLDFDYDPATRRTTWTDGTIGYRDDNNASATQAIDGGTRTNSTGGPTYFYWQQGSSTLLFTTTYTAVIASNRIHIATWSNATGLVVYKGSSMIHGSRIIAASITADNIAAGQIQTNHMSSNSINGDRITAGTIAASKIVASSITATQLAADCVTATQLKANAVSATHIVAGTITATEIANATITNAKIVDATLTGAKLANATITDANIGTAAITSAKIDNLAVTNIKVADGAISQTASASNNTKAVTVQINCRGTGKVTIQGIYDGNSQTGSTQITNDAVGLLQIIRNKNNVETVLKSIGGSTWVANNNPKELIQLPAAIAVTDEPGAGTVSYRFQHTTNMPVPGVTIIVTELSK